MTSDHLCRLWRREGPRVRCGAAVGARNGNSLIALEHAVVKLTCLQLQCIECALEASLVLSLSSSELCLQTCRAVRCLLLRTAPAQMIPQVRHRPTKRNMHARGVSLQLTRRDAPHVGARAAQPRLDTREHLPETDLGVSEIGLCARAHLSHRMCPTRGHCSGGGRLLRSCRRCGGGA